MKIEKLTLENEDFRGDDHVGSSAQTPLRTDAFDLDDDQKIELIQEKVGEILHTLGMDLTRSRPMNFVLNQRHIQYHT